MNLFATKPKPITRSLLAKILNGTDETLGIVDTRRGIFKRIYEQLELFEGLLTTLEGQLFVKHQVGHVGHMLTTLEYLLSNLEMLLRNEVLEETEKLLQNEYSKNGGWDAKGALNGDTISFIKSFFDKGLNLSVSDKRVSKLILKFADTLKGDNYSQTREMYNNRYGAEALKKATERLRSNS